MSSALATILFFLPAGIANAAPVLANKIPVIKKWQTPLDMGVKWQGKPLLGKNKTWRGLITGSLIAGLSALLLSPVVDYGGGWPVAFGLGAVMGFGALFGDAAESALKRQRGITSGNSWFPFDQVDYIIGGLIFLVPVTNLTWSQMGLIFVSFFGLHLLTAYVGYLLGLKDKPI